MPRLAERLSRDSALVLVGALGSTAVAVLLFVRWGISGNLSRDESIYTYGGQQLAHGVAPFASIFDLKGPGATMLASVGAGIGHMFGRDDISFVRLMFFLASLLAVIAVYALAVQLWRSVPAGVVAAVVFASFTGFAADALSGPDAKTPGVAAVVLSMWLATRRRWLSSGVLAGIGFIVWQPFLPYAVIIALVALMTSEGGRRWQSFGRAAGGAIASLAVVSIYFVIAGAFGKFVEAVFVYPLRGAQRSPVSVADRISKIFRVIHESYGVSGALLLAGIGVLLIVAVVRLVRGRAAWRTALRDPLICIVLTTMLANIAYACADFQGYPDVYPLLPYGALGIGTLAAVAESVFSSATATRVVVAAGLGAAMVLAALSWTWFGTPPANDPPLRDQRADACGVQRILGPSGRLWVLGDPTPLVLLHRRNPDRFIYLGAGVDQWRIKHTRGGFQAWTNKIQTVHPDVVIISTWYGAVRHQMGAWLHSSGYTSRYIGPWQSFLTPAAVRAASERGVHLDREPDAYATGPSGHELPAAPCL